MESANLASEVFSDAFKASPVGILLEDLDGRPIFVNLAFCAMFGFDEAEVLRKRCVDFSPADDAENDWALFSQLQAGAIDQYQIDKRYMRRDGSLFWGRLSVARLDHQPVPIVVLTVQDITDRVMPHETLELATRDAIRVARCSRDLRYLWVSQGYASWLRRSGADIIGQPIAAVLGEQVFAGLQPRIERVLAGQALDFEQEVSVDGVGRRWISATWLPTRDPSGAVDGWVGVIVDITSQKAVQEELLRYALIVESTDDAVMSRSLTGLILSWNNAARRLFGYEEAEVVGQPLAVMVPDELREAEERILARVRAGEQVERYETRRLTRRGRPIDVAVTISPIRNRQGTIIGVCDVARDITDRKQMEQSLRWRLELERMLSELSRTLISLPDDEVDANVERALARIGGVLDVDRIALYEFARAREALAVTCAWTRAGTMAPPESVSPDLVPWWTERTLRGKLSLISRLDDLPEDAAVERERLRRLGIVSAASIPLNVGGEITGAISFISVRRQIVWGADLVGVLRVIGDIFSNALKRKRAMVELRRAQATTRESEERFRLVTNTTPAMIWVADSENRGTYFNQSWLAFTGRPLDAELGDGWTELVHPEDSERSRKTSEAAFARRAPFEMEFRMRRHDGQYRWLLDTGVPRFDLDGSFAGYIGSCVDLTDRREAESMRSNFSRRLIQAQEEERAAVSRELHDDINQRVALVAMNLSAIGGIAGIPPAVRQATTRVIAQLGELAADIQGLSHRLHSAKLEYLGLRVAAAGFCREVAEQHNVDITFHAESIPDDLRSEIALTVFRVLQEAVQNATKHSGATRLSVSLAVETNELQLVVEDSGAGFDVHAAMGGRGIGLANMRERLRLVRGTLALDTAPGRGTVLQARVPLGPRARPALTADE